MSNQARANDMGRQHRVIHGATGRGEGEAYSASSAVPSTGDLLLAQGEMPEVDAREAELEAPLTQGRGDSLCPFRASVCECSLPPSPPPHVPKTGNCSFWLVRAGGSVCLPAGDSAGFCTPSKPSLGAWCPQKHDS